MASDEQAKPEQPSAIYDGSCHYGANSFKVTLSPLIEEQKPTQCNCSICYRYGYHLVFAPDEKVEWLKGGTDAMTVRSTKNRTTVSENATEAQPRYIRTDYERIELLIQQEAHRTFLLFKVRH